MSSVAHEQENRSDVHHQSNPNWLWNEKKRNTHDRINTSWSNFAKLGQTSMTQRYHARLLRGRVGLKSASIGVRAVSRNSASDLLITVLLNCVECEWNMRTRAKAYTYIHTYIHTYNYIYIHLYIHTYIYIYPYIHINTQTYTYIYTYKHTYILTCIHTYLHIYIHTYFLFFIITFFYKTSFRFSCNIFTKLSKRFKPLHGLYINELVKKNK